MIRLIVLIGLPGSGKSSLARSLLSDCPNRQLVSTDAIRAQLFGDEAVQGSWLQVWREVERQLRHQVAAIQRGDTFDVIYDATNVRRRSRREAIALGREVGFNCITGVWVDTPLDLCLQRNRSRDRQVPEDVILRMSCQLHDAPPGYDEGFHLLVRYTGAATEYGNRDRPVEQQPNSPPPAT